MSRNTNYTPELANKICELIAEDNTYEQIAAREGMPSKATIIRWLGLHDDFETKCARARQIQADSIDDRIGNVIDKTEKGTLTPDVARVVLSGLQWRASKKDPKKYGDKQDLNITGKLESVPDDKLDARINELLGKAGAVKPVAGESEAESEKQNSGIQTL